MRHMLDLTPAQQEQVGEVMEKTHYKLFGLHSQFRRERRAVLLGAYEQIRGLLTPEQQKKFDREFVPPSLRKQLRTQTGTPQGSGNTPNAQPGPELPGEGAPNTAAHP